MGGTDQACAVSTPNSRAVNHTTHPPTPRHPWSRPVLTIALIVGIWYGGLLVYDWLRFRGEERVPGVITRPLGSCNVDWFYRRGGLIVLSCPRTGGIKFWPLPVEYPWFEDLPIPAWQSVT